ncbi:MAG: histidine kinase, partial [Lachnospiraceae bacterium]|nr:histidine kinase [Lachnospiraceae bacterium]
MHDKLKPAIAIAASFILSLGIFTNTVHADDNISLAIDPVADSGGYTGVLYDNSNGLPTSEANAIAETPDGFIWIGSYSGLIRYDGNTFERIDSTTGIASVVSLFVDSKERLWVGTNDSGAAVYERGEFKKYGKQDGLQSLSIRDITEDADGNIYLATTHGIATVGQDMKLEQLDSPLINDIYIYSLTPGADGVLYGVTRDGALFTVKDGRVTGFYEGSRLGIDSVRCVLPDPDAPGYVYIGTNESGIYWGKLENGLSSPRKNNTDPLYSINSIQKFNGDVWICADNGIGVLEGEKLTVLKNIPMKNAVEQVIVDYQGNLWFASSKQGVMKSVPNQFTDVFLSYDLPETVVNTTCLYNDTLFAGCKSSGLMVLGKDGQIKSMPVTKAFTASGKDLGATDLIRMLSDSNIRSIIRDSKNRLWISSYGNTGLIRYDGESLISFTKDDGLPSDRVRVVYERQDGSFLAACTGGLAVIRDDKVEEVYDKGVGLNDTEILTAIEADNKDIIAGTDGSGIYVIKDSQVIHLGIEDGLTSEVIMRIKKDTERKLYWIVTSNSIACMDEDYKISTIQKFPYSNNFDLYENANGEMWILSSNGVYVVSVDELIKNEEISPAYYGMDNGLPCITT